MMSLIFYGFHTNTWKLALTSDNLIELGYNIIVITEMYQLKEYPSIELTIPLIDKHYRELYDNNINIHNLPNREIFENFSCKKKFAQYVIDNDLTEYAPIRYNKDSVFDIAIVKRTNLFNGVGSRIIHQNEDKLYRQNLCVQEYIHGDKEYVAHIVVEYGDIKECIIYCYDMKLDVYIKKSRSKTIPTLVTEEHLRVFSLFLKDYKGVCCFDFKIIPDGNVGNDLPIGQIKVLEINPRMGGSLMYPENKNDLLIILKGLISINRET